jgi:putative PIN family toxin of toxin-antitoxin system
VTTEILEEYREIISRLVNEAVATNVIQTIINNPSTIFVTTYFHFNLIEKDPDDNKFVDCAIAANAKCIVTNDHHFDVLRFIGFPKIEVVRLEDFDSKGLNA